MPTSTLCVGMDDDGFVEVKRKNNRSIESRHEESGSTNGSEQRQGNSDRRGNARRAGYRKKNSRPDGQSSTASSTAQRYGTTSTGFQRSGKSNPHAGPKQESRKEKPHAAPAGGDRSHAATPNLAQRHNAQRWPYSSVPAVSAADPRKSASQRLTATPSGGMRYSSGTRSKNDASHLGQVETDMSTARSATAQPVAHASVPTNTPGGSSAAVPMDKSSTTAESGKSAHAYTTSASWAARAAQVAPDPSGNPASTATAGQVSELLIPGQPQLRVKTHGPKGSPSKASPCSNRSQMRYIRPGAQPRSSPHRPIASNESPALAPKPMPTPPAASPAWRGHILPAAPSELRQLPAQATPSASPAAAATPASASTDAVPMHAPEAHCQAEGEVPAPTVPSRPTKQANAWHTATSAASSSPGEFGDELAILAHSLIDNSAPPGREHACGISNPHSLCFMIAPLQAMLATRPFQALMSRLPDLKGSLVVAKQLPVLTGLAELADFIRSPSASAFDPAPLSKIVEDHNEREGFRGEDSPFSVAKRQPQLDAALLYLHVVDEIHDELDATLKRLGFREQAQQALEEDDGGWNLVGPKKQVREIRETKVASQGRNTPFGMAFRGVLAHHNRNPGKPESINLEPFTLLNVRPEIGAAGRDSVAAGLRRLCSRYRNPETGQEHRSLIAELPPVLVLQVGRFQYHKNALQKICAPVEHPMQLRLERDMLSQDARRQHNLYNLTAKVVHHGQSMNCGHYTTVALEGPGNWMKYDDGTVTQVSPAEAQKPDGYLLFYTVADSCL